MSAAKRAKLEHEPISAPADAHAATASADEYEIGALLGSGSFASVRRALHKSSGKVYAVKQVSKSLSIPGAAEAVATEIKMLRAIGVHRHVVSLIDEFEMPTALCLVLELAHGGEVFERIAEHGAFGEAAAAAIVRQVALALEHVHACHVVHSDIKPENVLYVSDRLDSEVKLADFGLAAFCGGPHTASVTGQRGSLSYLAPEELLTSRFDHAVDLWAVGVMVFVLLGGYLPFDPSQSTDDQTVRKRILAGQPAFTTEQGGYPQQWAHVSSEARALIAQLLESDPAKRLTATRLLATPWVAGKAPTKPLPESDVALKRFNEARRVWRLAADAVALVTRAPHATFAATPERGKGAHAGLAPPPAGGASGGGSGGASGDASAASAGAHASPAAVSFRDLPAAAKRELHAAFSAFDADGSGTISLRELRQAMHTLGASEADAEAMLEALDRDHDGTISFDEFALATAPLYQASSSALRRAFDFFDVDGSGTIEKRELEIVLTRLGVASDGGRMHKDVLDRIFATADANHDGKVSFGEFIALFAHDAVLGGTPSADA